MDLRDLSRAATIMRAQSALKMPGSWPTLPDGHACLSYEGKILHNQGDASTIRQMPSWQRFVMCRVGSATCRMAWPPRRCA